ncbi:NADPH-dependent FMN reductase-like [Parasponia andersonii]|uniref:NAD(P)H dehydrogenase (quinone) n=1 Tax=Parasponia andersonii TaxID=3476 RepID=A0A2P5DUD9_PARAD|nr:NADPH-dependent FMN reductase-like [Parasponia andersonii]
MGKGGGCVPSKKRAPIDVSDRDLQNPERDHPDSDQNQIPVTESTNPVQDGAVREVEQQQRRFVRIFIVFYSMYGHVDLLAQKMKKGVDSIDGAQAFLYRVPETLSEEVLEQMRVPQKHDDDEVPVILAEKLVEADGLLFGFPTRYGSMAAQMKAFFDSTAELWQDQRLAGVPAGLFVSTGTQGGGQETTAPRILVLPYLVTHVDLSVGVNLFRTGGKTCNQSLMGAAVQSTYTILSLSLQCWTAITQLAHHGMIYVPIGYTFGAGMFKMDSIRGGSPYGAGVFSGDGTREPSETELALAEHQGKYMAALVKRFARSKALAS